MVYELPRESPNDLRLLRNYEKNLKIGWRQSVVPISLLETNFSISVKKNYAKSDIKVFLSCPVLLDF